MTMPLGGAEVGIGWEDGISNGALCQAPLEAGRYAKKYIILWLDLEHTRKNIPSYTIRIRDCYSLVGMIKER